MSLPLKFCLEYNQGTNPDHSFYSGYSFYFNSSGPSSPLTSSRLETNVAVRPARPINNTGINPSNMPTTLKSINLTILTTISNAGLLFISSYLTKTTIERVSILAYN
jgi:hypothetical protein